MISIVRIASIGLMFTTIVLSCLCYFEPFRPFHGNSSWRAVLGRAPRTDLHGAPNADTVRTPGHARSTHRVLGGYSAGTHRAPGHRARAPANTTDRKRAVHDDASETTNKQASINRTTKRGDKANQKTEQPNTETTKQRTDQQTNKPNRTINGQTNKQPNLEFQAVVSVAIVEPPDVVLTVPDARQTQKQISKRTIEQSNNRTVEKRNKQTHLELQAVDADAVHRRAVRRDGRAPRRDALEPQ